MSSVDICSPICIYCSYWTSALLVWFIITVQTEEPESSFNKKWITQWFCTCTLLDMKCLSSHLLWGPCGGRRWWCVCFSGTAASRRASSILLALAPWFLKLQFFAFSWRLHSHSKNVPRGSEVFYFGLSQLPKARDHKSLPSPRAARSYFLSVAAGTCRFLA